MVSDFEKQMVFLASRLILCVTLSAFLNLLSLGFIYCELLKSYMS